MNQINQNNLDFKLADFHREAAEHRQAQAAGLLSNSLMRSVAARLLRRAADRLEPGKINENHIPSA